MTITGRFVSVAAALTLLVFALPVDPPWGLIIADGLLIVAAIADLLLACKTSLVTIERTVPPIVTLGTEASIEWAISNPRNRSLHVRIADELKPSLHADSRRADVRVPRNGRIVAETTIKPTRRGRFVIRKLTVRTYGPLGLAARQRTRLQESVLRVYPSFASRREAESRIERARVLEVGLRSVKGFGGGTEFEQLREYTVDDDSRRIDWAATARVGKPIVRTYRAERNQNVLVLMDCGRVMAGRVADVPRLEHAMDAVMTLSTVASRLGDRVGLIAFDNSIRSEVASRTGVSQVARITEAMYQLEAELLESDYRRAFVHALTRFRRRSLLVIITELSEQAVGEMLIPALPLVSKNHLVVVSSVQDPDVAEWARAIPTEANKAFRKAAAVNALNSRRLTVARLRSRGATVVDAKPGRLAADLADTYLKVKATGRL